MLNLSPPSSVAAAIHRRRGDDEPLLLTLEEVLHVVRLSRSTWFRGVRDGHYPKPIPMTSRKKLWRASDIDRLLRNGPTNPEPTTKTRRHK